MTPLEITSIGLLSGIAGWVIRHALSSKTFVKREVCEVVHHNLDETLKRIEHKIDKMNGGS